MINSDFAKTRRECLVYFKYRTCCVCFTFSLNVFFVLSWNLTYFTRKNTIDAYHLDSIKLLISRCATKIEDTCMKSKKLDLSLQKF